MCFFLVGQFRATLGHHDHETLEIGTNEIDLGEHVTYRMVPSDTELENLTNAVVAETLLHETFRNSGRSYGRVSSIFSRFTKALNLRRVVREIETSVMTSVSCTACKAGMVHLIVLY